MPRPKPTCVFELKNEGPQGLNIYVEPIALWFILPSQASMDIHLFGLDPVAMFVSGTSPEMVLPGISFWPAHGDYELFYDGKWKYQLIGMEEGAGDDLQNILGSPTAGSMSANELYGERGRGDLRTSSFQLLNESKTKISLVGGPNVPDRRLDPGEKIQIQLYGPENPITMRVSVEGDDINSIEFVPGPGHGGFDIIDVPKKNK